ncbi:Hypothetical protein CINCED_3A014614 [Cinara cedri]|uniref:Uncharacterized protein n=1 Tax=Cinara cedri TaxID=506608 RepID=A0A5E4NMH9_9HEMI|nr:Hypothetical protein CINCED_3A014614 [Cinara cedri]
MPPFGPDRERGGGGGDDDATETARGPCFGNNYFGPATADRHCYYNVTWYCVYARDVLGRAPPVARSVFALSVRSEFRKLRRRRPPVSGAQRGGGAVTAYAT